ncbi:metallophosphoesterase [Candidatus Sodalis sp. SoCistrobi]|uniref:metallophosphoesterase family protein n=1 Tax=Candidatus Sodalis sp. SoCistrobi TaxID=1922216 RepID=UPI00093D3BD6|nr:metallophosphoesterase [Candidatus Sodalis sp. SoCistrobi]
MIIGVISDIHQDGQHENDVLTASLKNMAKNGATALIMAGDIGDAHAKREKALSIITDCFPVEFNNSMMLMLGNHDVRTGAGAGASLDPDLVELYHDTLYNLGIQYYENTMCIDAWFNDYHVLCLNTDLGLKDMMHLNDDSVRWLKEKLAENSDIHKPIFVVTHQAFNATHWRAGLFGGFGDQDEMLKEIFSDYPQIVMLNGHIHNGFSVIECIQRPYGTLVEIPSLTRGENGVKSPGTGWLIKTSQDKFVFEAWDFYSNKKLAEYDQVINLPALSVLAKALTDIESSESQDLQAKAATLMNKKYINDIPSGDNTYREQGYYNIDKIYDEETWLRIEALRQNIIEYLDEEKFYLFPFENGKAITKASLRDALNEQDHVLIKMYDGGWAPKIFIPSIATANKTVKIATNAGYKTTVYYDNKEITLEKGSVLTLTTQAVWHEVNSR